MLLVMIQHKVGGTSMATFEFYFALRNPALAAALISVLFLIAGRLRLAAVSCGVTFLIHPLIALPLVGVLVLKILRLLFAGESKRALTVLLVLAFTMLPLACRVLLAKGDHNLSLALFLGTIQDPYLSIIRSRAGYLFLPTWDFHEIASYFSYGVFMAAVSSFVCGQSVFDDAR